MPNLCYTNCMTNYNNKKKAIWWSGFPNTSAWAQKYRLSLSMELKWLPLLKPHLKHSLHLKVWCEALTVYEKISAVWNWPYSCTWLAPSYVNSLSTVGALAACVHSASEKLVINGYSMWYCRELVVRGNDGQNISVWQGHTHTHIHTITQEA